MIKEDEHRSDSRFEKNDVLQCMNYAVNTGFGPAMPFAGRTGIIYHRFPAGSVWHCGMEDYNEQDLYTR